MILTFSIFIGIILLIIAFMIKGAKCPECGRHSVYHSHSELVGGTDVEVYECKNCGAKFV